MRFLIGIDPGTKTGIALWDVEKKELMLRSLPIHKAMMVIRNYSTKAKLVRVEDSRKRKWYGKDSNSKLKGAGSIERDCKIWEDFLTDEGIPFEMVHPIKSGTKWNAKHFEQWTGYKGRTNSHERDAALLVYGM